MRGSSELIRAAKDDQDYDAAEIDRELIAARLQKDVVSYFTLDFAIGCS